MFRRTFFFIIPALMVFAAAMPGRAEEAVWTGLLLATNEEHPKDPPPELARCKGPLRGIFGYNQFRLISGRSEVVSDDEERWLLPSKNFSVRVDCRKVGRSRYVMELLFFQNERLLVKAWTKLGRQSPLFIRGPQYGRGQLIIVLLVQ